MSILVVSDAFDGGGIEGISGGFVRFSRECFSD